jgi:hypothetical protein
LGRTNIAISDEIAEKVSLEADRENKTLYGFANECFESLTKIFNERGRIEEVFPYWLQTKMSKEFSGLPLTPRFLLDSIIRAFYGRDKETLLKLSFESGGMLGNYFKLRAKNLDGLKELIDVVGSPNPARLMELIKTEDHGSTKYIFRYITGISDETTICLEKYFSGMLSVFSTDFTSRIQSSGIVEIEIRTAR